MKPVFGVLIILTSAIGGSVTPLKSLIKIESEFENIRGLRNEDELFCTANENVTMLDERNGKLDPKYKWSEFVVYLQDRFTKRELNMIKSAMARVWKVIPCIKFSIQKSRPKKTDYVFIARNPKNGCRSDIGRRGGGQEMNLAPQCFSEVGVVIHEIIHALGFYHEHSRPDRDENVIYLWWNVKKGKENNFTKREDAEVTSFGVPYNIESIMHYGSYQGSRNGWPVLVTLRGETFERQRAKMKGTDILKLKKMYKC